MSFFTRPNFLRLTGFILATEGLSFFVFPVQAYDLFQIKRDKNDAFTRTVSRQVGLSAFVSALMLHTVVHCLTLQALGTLVFFIGHKKLCNSSQTLAAQTMALAGYARASPARSNCNALVLCAKFVAWLALW
jgi:hypothetical protein